MKCAASPFLEEGRPLFVGPELAERVEGRAVFRRQRSQDRNGGKGNRRARRHAADYRTGSVDAKRDRGPACTVRVAGAGPPRIVRTRL